jgi:multiple sugar transport system substrate-binding protein
MLTAEPLTLTYLTPFAGGDGEFFDAMAAEYNKAQQEIILKKSDLTFSGYYVKLKESVQDGTAPDLVVVNMSRLRDLASGNTLIPLDPYLVEAGIGLKDIEPVPLKFCLIDGKTWAVPLDVHPLVLFYNRALLKQAGITRPPQNFKEVVEAAQAAQKKTGAIGIALDNTQANFKCLTFARMFMSLLEQQGKSALSPNYSKAAFNNPEGERAYKLIYDLVNTQKLTPPGLDYDFSVKYFQQGKAAFHVNGVWVTGLFESQKDLDFGVIPFPRAFKKDAAWSGSHVFAIPRQKSQDPLRIKGALRAVEWLSSHSELWAKAGNIPVRMSVIKKPAFKELPHRSEYAVAAKSIVYPPDIPVWADCYNAMADELEAGIAHGESAHAVLTRLERRINDSLQKK